METVIKQYGIFEIVKNGDDFNVIRNGELMLTNMSLNKAEEYCHVEYWVDIRDKINDQILKEKINRLFNL